MCPYAGCGLHFRYHKHFRTHLTDAHLGRFPYLCPSCCYCTDDFDLFHAHVRSSHIELLEGSHGPLSANGIDVSRGDRILKQWIKAAVF